MSIWEQLGMQKLRKHQNLGNHTVQEAPWFLQALQFPQSRHASSSQYRQVGVIRAAHKGCKSWNPPEAQKELRAASLGIPAGPTLVSMLLARLSTNLQRKIDLTNAFESFSRDDSFSHAAKSLDPLGNRWPPWETALEALGGGTSKQLRATRLGTCRGP